MNSLIHIYFAACLFLLFQAPAAIGQEATQDEPPVFADPQQKPPVFAGPADSAFNNQLKKSSYFSVTVNLGFNNIDMFVLGLDLSYKKDNLLFSARAGKGYDLACNQDMGGSIVIRTPKQDMTDFTLLFGLISQNGKACFSLRSGLGFMALFLRGNLLRANSVVNLLPFGHSHDYEDYSEEKLNTFYLPFEGDLVFYGEHIGCGLNAGFKLFGSRFVCQANVVVSVR